jgi:hypothetical protein
LSDLDLSIESVKLRLSSSSPLITFLSIIDTSEVHMASTEPIHPQTHTTGLFSPSLICPQIASSLPTGYTVRALEKSDYSRGFLDCLRVLTTVGDITEQAWNERYDWMNTQGKGGYYLLVIENGEGRIVGTGALIVERKL